MIDFINKILFLNPDAKFAVRETEPSDDEKKVMPETLHILDGKYLMWNPSNTVPPPTQAELDAVSDEQVNQRIQADARSKKIKDLKNDLSIKALFKLEKAKNSDLTFSSYIEQLEAEVIS